MNDRVKTELLAEAAGRATASVVARTGGALITAEYEGKSYSFRADGWFNATEAAKRYGKEPSDWISQKETQNYIQALDCTYRLGRYVETSRARADRGGGTWLHPKLAVRFARWLNVHFEIWCDMQIDKILRGEPLDSIDDELTTVDERIPFFELGIHALKRFRISFPKTYRAINNAAGCTNFRFMLRRQRAVVLPAALRINSGTDTQADWDMLHINGKQLRGNDQLELTFAESAAYNPIKEAS